MKKILCFAVTLLTINAMTAQNSDENTSSALQEGSWVIEANTGSWTTGSTAFSLSTEDGSTMWSIGAEAGYFVIDDLAIKAGLGYADFDGDFSVFSYKIGVKYYIVGEFPVGADFTGSSYKDFDENPSYVGIQGGYAWFVADNISIEPTLRYNISMNSDFYDDAFQGLIGFAFHF